MEMRYSAVIRTIGYNSLIIKTLESLKLQTLVPDEILIVLPEGVESWETNISQVRFVYSEKGMVTQRAKGIAAAKHQYALLLDDDILLEPGSAEVLLRSLWQYQADCVVPYWSEGWPSGINRVISAFWGIAIPRRKGGIKYTAGGGYYFPLSVPGPEGWETFGGAGAVMAINRKFAVEKRVLGDKDLEKVRYALRDDGAFILALAQSGGKCLMVQGVKFTHLGVNRVSTSNIAQRYEAHVVNQYIFWSKYILPHYQSPLRRLKAKMTFLWYLMGIGFLASINSIRHLSIEPLKGIINGFNRHYTINKQR